MATNVIVEPSPSNWVKVKLDDGTEISFSLGAVNNCQNFQKFLQKDTASGNLSCECECGRSDWWYSEGYLHLRSSFHDHRTCERKFCIHEYRRSVSKKVMENVESQDWWDYETRLANAIRYIFPKEKDDELITNFVKHKISLDFAIEPIYDVEMNWFSCCGVCQHNCLLAPTVKSMLFYGKPAWKWMDCPWDELYCYKMC